MVAHVRWPTRDSLGQTGGVFCTSAAPGRPNSNSILPRFHPACCPCWVGVRTQGRHAGVVVSTQASLGLRHRWAASHPPCSRRMGPACLQMPISRATSLPPPPPAGLFPPEPRTRRGVLTGALASWGAVMEQHAPGGYTAGVPCLAVWRLEVPDQGVSRAGLPLRPWGVGEGTLLCFFRPLWPLES